MRRATWRTPGGREGDPDDKGDVPGECSDGAGNDRDGDYDRNHGDWAGSPDCTGTDTPGVHMGL